MPKNTPIGISYEDFDEKKSGDISYLELKQSVIKKYFGKQITTILIIEPRFGKFAIYCNIHTAFPQGLFDSVQECIEQIEMSISKQSN